MEDLELYLQVYKKLQESRGKEFSHLLKQLEGGEYDSWQPVLDRLFSLYGTNREQMLSQMAYLNGPRPHYISPLDRGSYNYGYIEQGQFDGKGQPHGGE